MTGYEAVKKNDWSQFMESYINPRNLNISSKQDFPLKICFKKEAIKRTKRKEKK